VVLFSADIYQHIKAAYLSIRGCITGQHISVLEGTKRQQQCWVLSAAKDSDSAGTFQQRKDSKVLLYVQVIQSGLSVFGKLI
jgi:hypothetical protein